MPDTHQGKKHMKKRWYYILVAVGLAMMLAGCDSHELNTPNNDNLDPPPKIDPPVNELLRKDFGQKLYDKKLDAYEVKYVRKPQQQTAENEE